MEGILKLWAYPSRKLSQHCPAQVAYIIDTPRCVGPQTFMTNMLQVGPSRGIELGLVTGWEAGRSRGSEAVTQPAASRTAQQGTVPHPCGCSPAPNCSAASRSIQACSILYKTRLPVLLVFNKVGLAAGQRRRGRELSWRGGARATAAARQQPHLRQLPLSGLLFA